MIPRHGLALCGAGHHLVDAVLGVRLVHERGQGDGQRPHDIGPSNVPARRIEVLWFDRTDVSLRYKCQTGLLTSEPCSPWLTDTDNAHTDNAIKSHLTAEMMAGRLEKRGACARCAHHTLKHSDASSAARGELLVDIRMFASRGDFDTHDLLVRGGVG